MSVCARRASFRGQEPLLRALHAAGVKLSEPDAHTRDYALHFAARGNHVGTLRTLLALAPDTVNGA